ncbi:MAG: DNA topoisomerase IB [Bacteroidota bacterium]
MQSLPPINLSTRKFKAIANDSKKSAEAINLLYVTDAEPGILRVKKGSRFLYLYNQKKINDGLTLKRIKSLVIPPAWENVWICKFPDGHIQTTGLDIKRRKQYKYHPLWNQLRNQTKFFRMLEFGESLPQLRLHLEKDISQKDLTEEKVIATVISLMERTYIRIGNSAYEKLYGSHGLTTMKDKHVKISGANLSFSFKGKKGILHNISLKNKRLARIVKQCRDIPGKELFQYKDENGNFKTIDSGKVNAYIKNITGKEFTAKDFRTWAGSLNALHAFKKIGFAETVTASKKNIVEALDFVSHQLGNTRTVCKKYYVHPMIIEMYENKTLQSYLDELDKIERDDAKTGLAIEEKILMKILKTN